MPITKYMGQKNTFFSTFYSFSIHPFQQQIHLPYTALKIHYFGPRVRSNIVIFFMHTTLPIYANALARGELPALTLCVNETNRITYTSLSTYAHTLVTGNLLVLTWRVNATTHIPSPSLSTYANTLTTGKLSALTTCFKVFVYKKCANW